MELLDDLERKYYMKHLYLEAHLFGTARGVGMPQVVDRLPPGLMGMKNVVYDDREECDLGLVCLDTVEKIRDRIDQTAWLTAEGDDLIDINIDLAGWTDPETGQLYGGTGVDAYPRHVTIHIPGDVLKE